MKRIVSACMTLILISNLFPFQVLAGTDNSWHIFEDGNEPSNITDSGIMSDENRQSVDYSFSAFDSKSVSSQGSSATIALPGGGTTTVMGGSASATAVASSIVNIRMEWPKVPVVQGTILRSLNNRYGVTKVTSDAQGKETSNLSGYRPKLDELEWLTSKIGQLTGKWVMYTGDFDNGPVVKDNSDAKPGTINASGDDVSNTSNTREQNILGEDIYMYDYTADFTRMQTPLYAAGANDASDPDISINKKCKGMVTEYYFGKEDKSISKAKALQAMYKAIGPKRYSVDLFTVDNAKYFATKNMNLPIVETPFINNVQDSYTDVSSQNYYTYSYISRTKLDYYTLRAYSDGVTENKEFADKNKAQIVSKTDAKTKAVDKTANITVIDFCHSLKNLLYVNGEPELTDKEATAILTFYGRTLPQGLTDAQIEDVKYLLARGIIDSNLNFSGLLDVPTMMQMLMRAADKGSRLTFKQMQIVYNEDLTSQGYYPVDVTNSGSTISNVRQDPTSLKAANTYDYFVAVNNTTQFSAGNNPYISDKAFETAEGKARDSQVLEGSQYMGIKKNHYWFKIPVNVPAEAMGKDQNYVTVAFTQKNDSVKYYKLELGGGYYESANPAKGNSFMFFNRRPFNVTEYPAYVDKDSKLRAQNSEDGSVLLAGAQPKKFTMKIAKPEDVSFCGSLLTANPWPAIDKEAYPGYVEQPVKGKNNIWTFTISDEGNNAAGFLAQYLSVGSGSTATFSSYMKSSDAVLVDSRFLKDINRGDNQLIKIAKIDEEKDPKLATYRLTTRYENIIVNNRTKRVVRGQSICCFSADTELMVPQDNTDVEFFIDVRVLTGVIDNYLVMDTPTSGTKTISNISDIADNKNKTGAEAGCLSTKLSVTNANGLDGNIKASFVTNVNDSAKDRFQVEPTYPEANYFVYYTDAEKSQSIYLVVLHPKTPLTDTYEDDKTRKVKTEFMSKSFGYNLLENEYATIYRIENSSDTKASIQNLDLPVIALNSQNCVLSTSVEFGLVYRVPDMENFDYTSYLNGKAITNPLPIVQVKAGADQYGHPIVRYVNINVNKPATNPNATNEDATAKFTPYRTIYASYMSVTMNNIVKSGGTDIVFNPNGPGFSLTKAVSPPTEFIPAPIGTQRFFAQTITADLWTVVNDKSGKIYYGSMYGNVETLNYVQDDVAEFQARDGVKTFVIPNYSKVRCLSAFISSIPGQSVYVITPDDTIDGLKNTITNQEISTQGLDPVPTLTPGGTKKWEFNFSNYDLKTMLTNADGLLSVVYYIVMGFFPRAIFFIFLLLAMLSLIADAEMVKWFCTNVFDFYKFFSCTILNVETVRPLSLWVSTFIATIFVVMLSNENLMALLSWLNRNILALLGH